MNNVYESISEPSCDECSAKAKVYSRDGMVGYACWYPQMGGYVGKAVVLFSETQDAECFDVLVWHDGEFPFSSGMPAMLHHCSPGQFIEFGRDVYSLMGFDSE